jgi:hypothetical protein
MADDLQVAQSAPKPWERQYQPAPSTKPPTAAAAPSTKPWERQYQPTVSAQIESSYGPKSAADVAGEAITNLAPDAAAVATGMASQLKGASQSLPGRAGHVIYDTAKSLKNLGLGVVQHYTHALPDWLGAEPEQYADEVGRYLKTAYGSTAAIKHQIAKHPAQVFMDMSLLFGAGRGIVGAPSVTGTVAGAVGNRAVAPLLGVRTGAGGEAIRTAVGAGKKGGAAAEAFQAGRAGEVESVVAETRDAVGNLRQQASRAYNEYKDRLGQQSQVLDFGDVDAAVNNAVKTFTPTGTNLPAVSLSDRVDDIRTKIGKAVQDWKRLGPQYHTAEGFDALKQKIWDIGGDPAYGTAERKAVGEVYNAIKQTIIKQDPEYGKAMSEYSAAQDQIREIERELTGKRDAPAGPALRKIMSALRSNVNTNYGTRKKLLDVLAENGAPNVAEKVAGAALASREPRGLARTGGVAAEMLVAGAGGLLHSSPAAVAAALGTGAVSAASRSPRLVGGAAYGLGSAMNVPPVIGTGARATRAGQLLQQIQQEQGQQGQQPQQ